MPPLPSYPVRLVSTRDLSPLVRELIFERDEGPVDFAPGQWVSLVIPPTSGADAADQPVRRSYSIASAPEGASRFELAVTRVEGGPGSTRLHALRPGATLQATGPQGFFTRAARGGPPSLFVGTGTGVTPLRSMMQAALASGASEPLWLLFGVRHEVDLIYRDELERMAAERPNVRVTFTLSRPGEGWAGATGYVQAHLPRLWTELTAASGDTPPHLYVCGLERMVKSVRDLMKHELGVTRERVHSERYD